MRTNGPGRIGYTVILIALICSPNFCSIAGASERPVWQPPKDGVVRDADTAISVARLIWFSMNPELKRSSDGSWQSAMTAVNEKDVWRVAQKTLPAGSIGGGLEIDISASDGRVIGVYLTQ